MIHEPLPVVSLKGELGGMLLYSHGLAVKWAEWVYHQSSCRRDEQVMSIQEFAFGKQKSLSVTERWANLLLMPQVFFFSPVHAWILWVHWSCCSMPRGKSPAALLDIKHGNISLPINSCKNVKLFENSLGKKIYSQVIIKIVSSIILILKQDFNMYSDLDIKYKKDYRRMHWKAEI